MRVKVDSDWAGDAGARRSTACAMAYAGSRLVEAVSRNQSTVALASGEAELSAINKGAASGIWVKQFLDQRGLPDLIVNVASDSSAGRAMATRIGSGKVRHLASRELGIYEKVKDESAEIAKARGTSRTTAPRSSSRRRACASSPRGRAQAAWSPQ